MVVKKRQSYGSNGFIVPFVPRAPRSARGSCLGKRKAEDSRICAIELLASLAGKLLQESESSASSNASETDGPPVSVNGFVTAKRDDNEPGKAENLDVESCENNVVIPEFDRPFGSWNCVAKESPCAGSDSIPGHSSVVTSPDLRGKASIDAKSIIFQNNEECEDIRSKIERSSSGSDNSFYGHLGIGVDGKTMADGLGTRSSDKDFDLKLPALISSNNEIKSSAFMKPVHNTDAFGCRNNVNLGFRDDDENFFGNNKPIWKPKALRPPSRVRDRRIRKPLTSRFWRVGPKLKDCDQSTIEYSDGGTKPCYGKRKMCYNPDRCYRDALYKRRKFSRRSLIVTSDGGFSSESVCNSPEKSVNTDNSATSLSGANGVPFSVIGHQALPKDSHVKFSIKSFRIPELVIEVPEKATVASLKKTVLEAVNSLLGGGFHIGVLLHGKKVKNDNRTLLQSGIASKDNFGSLGFALEPASEQPLLPLCTEEDPPAPLSCDISEHMSRSPAATVRDSGIPETLLDPPPLICSDNKIENNCHPVCSHNTDIFVDNRLSDSKALVAITPVNAEALAVVPASQKPKRSELVQRRTRRPFSVTEVEALVSAVEELGTGRWRDIKLRSFEDADHRTYVDLKDKWKTLVHTAKITPQQRRGEPVPQELLYRVLAAHSHWSRLQGKHQNKAKATAIVKIADNHMDWKGVEGNDIVVETKGNNIGMEKGQVKCTNGTNLCSILPLT